MDSTISVVTKSNKNNKSGVYKLNCGSRLYCGPTGRSFKKQVAKHKRSFTDYIKDLWLWERRIQIIQNTISDDNSGILHSKRKGSHFEFFQIIYRLALPLKDPSTTIFLELRHWRSFHKYFSSLTKVLSNQNYSTLLYGNKIFSYLSSDTGFHPVAAQLIQKFFIILDLMIL